MSQSSSSPTFLSVFLLTFHLLARVPISLANSGLPDPNPDPVQTQTFFPTTATSSPATIPGFPEQSDAGTCPLDLPDGLFRGIRSACGSGRVQRIRCCPALAAWVYSAYSTTALRRAKAKAPTAFDVPVLPDDSETCVRSLENALVEKGIELAKPNQSCDVMYCYCGIRLHRFSCPEAFSVNSRGELVGDERVKRLERDCLSGGSATGHSAAGCSDCLNSLYMLSSTTTTTKYESSNRSDADRGGMMRARDCQVMGLTWLLNRNRSTYIPRVTSVLRALMMSADPMSCTLDHNGMPLAVASSEFGGGGQSSSPALQFPTGFAVFFLSFVLSL